MHIVEVRPHNADLATVLPGRETRFRVQFRKRGDAMTFASNFDGKVLEAAVHGAAA